MGKTQFSLFLATKVSLSDVGGGNVLYIDTKNDFCIERLVEIIDSTLSTKINDAKTGTKINDALEKIHVCKVNDLTTLGNVLHMIDGSKVRSFSYICLCSWGTLHLLLMQMILRLHKSKNCLNCGLILGDFITYSAKPDRVDINCLRFSNKTSLQ